MNEKTKGPSVDTEAVRREQRKRVYAAMGRLVRAARLEWKWSEKELGTRVGMEASRIQAIERGSRWARVHEIYLLADALKVSALSLVPLREDLNRETKSAESQGLEGRVIPAGSKPPYLAPGMVLFDFEGERRVVFDRGDAATVAVGHQRYGLCHVSRGLVMNWTLAEPFVMKPGEPDDLPTVSRKPQTVFTSPSCQDHSGQPLAVVADQSVLPAGKPPPYLQVGMKLIHPLIGEPVSVIDIDIHLVCLGSSRGVLGWMKTGEVATWPLAEDFDPNSHVAQSARTPPGNLNTPGPSLPTADEHAKAAEGRLAALEERLSDVNDGTRLLVGDLREMIEALQENVRAWGSAHAALAGKVEQLAGCAKAGERGKGSPNRTGINTPEPAPRPNGSRPIWELVIEDMRERDRMGRAKYGVPLQAHNGRNPLVDAYQEGLDKIAYLRQAIEEGRGGVSTPVQGVPPVWRVMGPKSVHAGRERLVKLFRDRVQAIYCLAEERGRGGSGGLVFERSDDAGETWGEEDSRWAPDEDPGVDDVVTHRRLAERAAPAASSTPQPAPDDENRDFSQQGGGA